MPYAANAAGKRRLSMAGNNAGGTFPFKYLIVPQFIIADSKIPDGAKILFCEIAYLSLRKGYAFFSNGYVARLHSINERTVTRWIHILKERQYITVETIYEDKSKEIRERRIRPNGGNTEVAGFAEWYGHFCREGSDKNVPQGSDKNVADNNMKGKNIMLDTDKRNKTVRFHSDSDRIPECELDNIPF